MKKYRVIGPDGVTHTINADNEGALYDAIEQLWPDDPKPEPEEKPDHSPAILETLKRIADKPEVQPVDLEPLARAIRAMPPPDLGSPLIEHAQELREMMDEQTDGLRKELADMRAEFRAGIERLCAIMAAPRKLKRDSDGRPIGAVIEMDD